MDPERTPLAGSSESIETPHVGGDPEGERAEIAEAVYVEDEVPTPPAEQMRELLPALEPERRVTDWSRSERVEAALDRTLVEFFYRYWLRCEVEGIENVRAVANPLAATRERASNATGGVSASERGAGHASRMMFERGFAADREWKPAVTDAYTYRTQFQTAP